MSDLYNQIVSKRSGLERIVAKIPGFRGYKEMTARRDADRMIRDHVVKLLKEQMARLVTTEKKLMSSGGLAAVGKTRSAKTNFQVFIDRINTAAPGYSGFYSAKKIGPEELEKIYSFDAALIEYVDHFSKAIDALNTAIDSKGNVDEPITALETLAQEANAAYAMRDNVLTEIY